MSRRALLVTFLIFPQILRADELLLKNGQRLPGSVTAWNKEGVSYRPARGSMPIGATWESLERILFAVPRPDAEAMRRATAEQSSEPLAETWIRQTAWLGCPHHHAGETGLAYAHLLLLKPTRDRYERADAVLLKIEKEDWSPERRVRAKAGRLRILLRQGRAAEARPAALQLMREHDAPRVLIELHYLTAETAETQLKILTTRHPRWDLEEEIKAHRAILHQEAESGYLYGSVHHGAEEDLAARGLWAAAQLHITAALLPRAHECAQDLLQRYPQAPEAALARQALPTWPAAPAPTSAATPASPPAESPVIKTPRKKRAPRRPSAAPHAPATP